MLAVVMVFILVFPHLNSLVCIAYLLARFPKVSADTLSVLKRDWRAANTTARGKYFRPSCIMPTSGSHDVCSVGRNHASSASLECRRSGCFRAPCAARLLRVPPHRPLDIIQAETFLQSHFIPRNSR